MFSKSALRMLFLLLLFFVCLIACERVEVDEGQYDLMEPYMPNLGTGYPEKRGGKQPPSRSEQLAEVARFYNPYKASISEGRIAETLESLQKVVPKQNGLMSEQGQYLISLCQHKLGRLKEARQTLKLGLLLFPGGPHGPERLRLLKVVQSEIADKDKEPDKEQAEK